MVKKLIKHEFISYLRSLLPIELALIGIATVLRFIILETFKYLSNLIATSEIFSKQKVISDGQAVAYTKSITC